MSATPEPMTRAERRFALAGALLVLVVPAVLAPRLAERGSPAPAAPLHAAAPRAVAAPIEPALAAPTATVQLAAAAAQERELAPPPATVAPALPPAAARPADRPGPTLLHEHRIVRHGTVRVTYADGRVEDKPLTVVATPVLEPMPFGPAQR